MGEMSCAGEELEIVFKNNNIFLHSPRRCVAAVEIGTTATRRHGGKTECTLRNSRGNRQARLRALCASAVALRLADDQMQIHRRGAEDSEARTVWVRCLCRRGAKDRVQEQQQHLPAFAASLCRRG